MRLGILTRGATGALILAGCALALGSGGALAGSACKGMAQDACEKAADCIWVGGYQKKDGKQVSGYCRAKAAGGAATEKKAGAATGGQTPATPAAPSASGTAKDKAKTP